MMPRLIPCLDGADGLYTGGPSGGVVKLSARERDLRRLVHPALFKDHRALFDRLGVACARQGPNLRLDFTPDTARAYVLLHILLHELGHHRDRITSRAKAALGRGESFAEAWAFAT